jgi:hypothetical protein
LSRDDAAAAYSCAGPEIRGIFPQADIFMSMVQQSYAPAYRHKSFEFGEARTADGRIAQPSTLSTPMTSRSRRSSGSAIGPRLECVCRSGDIINPPRPLVTDANILTSFRFGDTADTAGYAGCRVLVEKNRSRPSLQATAPLEC